MAVKWFPVDSDNANDPKIKALIRHKGRDGYGAWMLLCSYVADHGKADPGLACRADSTPLPLSEICDELLFESTPMLCGFLDFLAERELIHTELWKQKQMVLLPAMWNRLVGYNKGKGRYISHFQTPDGLGQALINGTPVITEQPPAQPAKTRKNTRKSRSTPATSPEVPLQYSTEQDSTTQHRTTGPAASAGRQPDAKEHTVKEVLTYHDQLFTERTGQPYPGYTAGDAANVKHMLKKTPKEDLKAEVLQMFQSTDPFIQQCGYTIGAFQKLRPKLIVAKTGPANRGDPGSKGRTPVEPGKYAGA